MFNLSYDRFNFLRALRFLQVFAVVLGAMLATQHGQAVENRERYVVLNLQRNEIRDDIFAAIAELAAEHRDGTPRLGVGIVVSYLAAPRERYLAQLQQGFRLAEKYNLAVVVQLDGEQWWQGRPDLWNWWDADQPGYDPANVANVEWSGWGPEQALKIAWRNWGRQLRVLPPPNLMSPDYRQACHEEMVPLLREVLRWRDSLSDEQSHLFIGVKLGWESSIGVNAYYYPDGNELLDADPAEDPKQPIEAEDLPSRGFQTIGYAAVATAGLADEGELQEQHIAEVVRRHLSDLASAAREAGLPREQIFVHSGGWAPGESLYAAALNECSCPGWSFYGWATDPTQDETAMRELRQSDAPYWGAVEWWPQGAQTADDWAAAIRTTLAIDRCRYMNIYNWRAVAPQTEAIEGIRKVLRGEGD